MWRYVSSMRLSRLMLAGFLLFVVILPIIYYLATIGSLMSLAGSSTRVPAAHVEAAKVKAHLEAQSNAARMSLGLISDEEWRQAGDLCSTTDSEMGPGFKKRLEELMRVKQSVQVELRSLEKQRMELQVRQYFHH